MALENHLEQTVLRESLRARVSVMPYSLFSTYFAIFLFIPFLLFQGVSYGRIALWTVPIMLLMLARFSYSRRTFNRLDQLSARELSGADWMLRFSSIFNQVAVGVGIWLIHSPSANPFLIPLFMTLVVIIWMVGVLVNLFTDFLTFALSMPILIGQPVAYWLLQGDVGVSIGISMLMAMALSFLLVRKGTDIFRESVLIRFEKDQLLEQLRVERAKTEEALHEAQAANDAKAYFMAAASHDIKQPLYALGMLTDTMLMSDPPATVVSLLKNQRASITQMSEHFDALMDLGKFQSGDFQVVAGIIRLEDFAARVNAEIAPLCADKGLAWHLDVDNVQIATDAELLLRLFRNLLLNAVRYTDQGEVRCRANVENGVVKCLISDTGRGIATEDQKIVFQEFVRLPHASADSTGAGLGLSIVEKINRALGLDLQMLSAPGKGTEFRFQLPLEPGAASHSGQFAGAGTLK